MNRRFFLSIVLMLSLISVSNDIYAQNQELPSFVQLIAEDTTADINEIISKMDINSKINDLGWSPLHAAVKFKRDDVVKKLVELGAKVDIQDNSGQTPLYIAVELGQANTVDFLIKNGAGVNIAANNGENPLSIAEKTGLGKIRDTLLRNRATPPEPVSPDQGIPGSRRGMNPRRGGPGGEVLNPDIINNQINPNNPDQPVSMDMSVIQDANAIAIQINLDPNEVQARIQKYPGLQEAVAAAINGGKSSLRQWRRVDEDNKINLFSAVRRQFEDEIDFVKKTATEEKALKTVEATDKLIAARKEKYLAINREVRDEGQTAARTTTTTSTRRSTRSTATATTRSARRGTSATTETPTTTRATEQEKKYSPEVQSEIDTWLNASIINIGGRMTLLDSVNSTIISEISSIKTIATGEKAEKTVAAIDGVLLARQMGYDELQKEFQKSQQEQGTQAIYEMPNMMDGGAPPMDPGQDMTTGRGRRGR